METAVEQLVQEINKLTGLNIAMDEPCVIQAKAMEKEQIMDAFNSGMNNSVDYFIPFLEPNDESENYYKETFKSE